MSSCLADPIYHAFCIHHKTPLIENEHYDDWVQYADFSGFYCPGTIINNAPEGTDNIDERNELPMAIEFLLQGMGVAGYEWT